MQADAQGKRTPGSGSPPLLRRSRSKKFTFAPVVNGDVPQVDTSSQTFVRPRRKRGGASARRQGAATDRAPRKTMDSLAQLTEAELSDAWQENATFSSTGARLVAQELLQCGAKTRALLKPWERNDFWQTWLVGSDPNNGSGSGDGADDAHALRAISSSRAALPARPLRSFDSRPAPSTKASGGNGSSSMRSNLHPSSSRRPDSSSSNDIEGELVHSYDSPTSSPKDIHTSRSSPAVATTGGGGGVLSKQHFRKALRTVIGAQAFSAKDADALFDDLDEDRTGNLSIAAVVSGLKLLADDMHAVATGSAGSAKRSVRSQIASKDLEEQTRLDLEAARAKEEAEKKEAEAKRRIERASQEAVKMEAAAAAAEAERKRKAALQVAADARAAAATEASGRRRGGRNGIKFVPGQDEFKDAEQVRRWFRSPLQPAGGGDSSGVGRSRAAQMWQSAAQKALAAARSNTPGFTARVNVGTSHGHSSLEC